MLKTIQVYEADYEALLIKAGTDTLIKDEIRLLLAESNQVIKLPTQSKGTHFRLSNGERCPFHYAPLKNGKYNAACPHCNYIRPTAASAELLAGLSEKRKGERNDTP